MRCKICGRQVSNIDSYRWHMADAHRVAYVDDNALISMGLPNFTNDPVTLTVYSAADALTRDNLEDLPTETGGEYGGAGASGDYDSCDSCDSGGDCGGGD